MNKTQSIHIRPALEGDIGILTELSHRTVLSKYPSVIGAEMVQGYVESGAVPAYYKDRLAHLQVALIEGRIVGCYGLKENTVDLMMVDLDFHRSGIGRALLSHAESRLFAEYENLSLDSFRQNEQAVAFYKKHGWTELTQFVDPDYGIPMVKLVKKR